MNPFLMRRRMFMTKEENIILIKSDALEQGTIVATNGANYPSDYRVRTKDYMDLEKGTYEITCEGAIQGNLVEYDMNRTYKKILFKNHTLLPWVVEFTEKCKVRIVLSNGTEAEQILIKPSDVECIKIRKIT